MKTTWSHIPLVKMTLGLIAGIGLELVAVAKPPLNQAGLIAFAALLMSLPIAEFSYRRMSENVQYRFRLANAMCLLFLFISMGYVIAWFHADAKGENYLSHYIGSENFITLTISEPPVLSDNSVIALTELQTIRQGNSWLKGVEGKILLYLKKDSASVLLKYGDKLACHARIVPFEAPKNPDEFNFKRYQSYRNIYYQTYLGARDWKLIAAHQGSSFFSAIYQLRGAFQQTLSRYIHTPNDLAVASAMLLGYRDFMGDELIQAYSGSGVIHILSVSGLHIGIVFIMLNFLLQWADKKGPRWKLGKSAMIISLLWGYALLTGLSPSVLRSVAMFSMMQIGMAFFRPADIYNVIAGSILLLLLFNPFLVMDVGFQLSYLAVLGIIYLQPKIYSWIQFKRWLPDKIWILISVSLAAQIVTFPLSIYYFHQFPTLFLFTNLIAIPLSDMILTLGMSLFLLSWLPGINVALGFLLAKSIWLLNHFIYWIVSLPHALIYGISIGLAETILLYLLIVLFSVFIETKRPKWFLVSLSCLLFVCAVFAFHYIQNDTRNELAVYSIKGKQAMVILNERKVWYQMDSSLYNNHHAMLFHIQHHWWNCGIREKQPMPEIATSLPFGELIQFRNRRILLVHDEVQKVEMELPNKLKVDYVVLSGNATVYLTNLRKLVDFDTLIFDSSNKSRQVEYWKKDCTSMNLSYWDVGSQGAYVTAL